MSRILCKETNQRKGKQHSFTNRQKLVDLTWYSFSFHEEKGSTWFLKKSYIVSLQKVKVVFFFIQQHPAKVGWCMKQTNNARPKLVREPYTWLVFCWDKLFLWTWVRSPSESHKFMSNMWQLGFAKNTQNSKFMGFSRAHIEAWVKNAHLPSLFFIGRVQ